MMQMHVFGKLLNIGLHMNENAQWCKPPSLDGRNRGTRGEMWKKEGVEDKNRRCKGRKNFFPFRPSSLGGERGGAFLANQKSSLLCFSGPLVFELRKNSIYEYEYLI